VSSLTTTGVAPDVWQAMRQQAGDLVRSGFLPGSINTPEKAVAIMLTGRELGIEPMMALRQIHIIEGKPSLSAELIAGLVLSRVKGATLRPVESTNDRCVVHAARPGQEPTVITWTMDDAKRAGIAGKGNWKKYPRAMLRSRAMVEAARGVFPDASSGLYTPDELGAETDAEGEPVAVRTTATVVQQQAPALPEVDWLERIALAETVADLDGLAAGIRDARPANVAEVRDAFRSRREELSEPEPEPETPVGAPAHPDHDEEGAEK